MYIIIYDETGNQIKVPVSLGKEGEILRMVKGIPTWTPQDYVPTKLEVDAGSNVTVKSGDIVTLSARSELATSYKWNVVSSPDDIYDNTVSLVAPADGNLVIDGSKYAPGTEIVLKGNYKSVTINNLIGTPEKPILITNQTGSKVTIGNPSWAGSGFSYGLRTSNSRYFKIKAVNQGDITITGSIVTTLSPGNEPWKSAYRNMSFDNFSENFEIINVTTTNGGTSIVAKTDPTTNSQTWYPNRILGYMVFRNVVVSSSHNESFYIGHTATYWDIKNNIPIYTAPTNPDTQKQPILISSITIDHCKSTDAGKDGIQTSAAKYVEVLNCEVFNWAKEKNTAHNGGILIGGRVESSLVMNNNVHDGWGEAYQFYGVGVIGVDHIVTNNFFDNNGGDMMSLRGYNGAKVYIKGNTITDAGPSGNLIRVNGYYNKVNGKDVIQAVITDNILAGPHNNMASGGTVYDKYYIYPENPFVGIVTDTNNFKVPKTSDLTTSKPPLGVGATPSVTGPTNLGVDIDNPTSSITEASNLSKGTYVFQVTASTSTETASDTVTVTVV